MSLKKGIPEIVAKKMSFNPTIENQYFIVLRKVCKKSFCLYKNSFRI